MQGGYLNNVGYRVNDKFAFDCSHKFSLCYENGSHNGYTTEKLVQALAARTVPIYWGDPKVGDVFNTKAFIDANSFDSLESLISFLRHIDENDEEYMKMLREPSLLTATKSIDNQLDDFEAWLLNIFEQPIEKAHRRNREMHGRWYIERRFRLDPKANAHAIREMRKQWFKKAWNHLKRKIRISK